MTPQPPNRNEKCIYVFYDNPFHLPQIFKPSDIKTLFHPPSPYEEFEIFKRQSSIALEFEDPECQIKSFEHFAQNFIPKQEMVCFFHLLDRITKEPSTLNEDTRKAMFNILIESLQKIPKMSLAACIRSILDEEHEILKNDTDRSICIMAIIEYIPDIDPIQELYNIFDLFWEHCNSLKQNNSFYNVKKELEKIKNLLIEKEKSKQSIFFKNNPSLSELSKKIEQSSEKVKAVPYNKIDLFKKEFNALFFNDYSEIFEWFTGFLNIAMDKSLKEHYTVVKKMLDFLYEKTISFPEPLKSDAQNKIDTAKRYLQTHKKDYKI